MRLAYRSIASAVAAAALLTAGVGKAQPQGGQPAVAPAQAAPNAPPLDPNPPLWEGPEYVMGNPKAKVTVVEYGSASCSHCARFDIEEFPGLKARYIDTGKIRYIFREFITPDATVAEFGFLLARCGGEAKYWEALEAYFRSQTEIYKTGDLRGPVLRIAKAVGLTERQVEACIDSKPAQDALNARLQAALAAKIESTPTFLINGVEFHGSPGKEANLADLSAAIDLQLAPAPRKVHRKAAS